LLLLLLLLLLLPPIPHPTTLHPPSRLQLGDNFNGADLRNICTEAGMFAIRDERDYTVQEDYMKVRWGCYVCPY